MDFERKKQKFGNNNKYSPILENEEDNQDLLRHLENHKRNLEADEREVISTETIYIPKVKRFMTGRICREDGNLGFLIDQLDLYTNHIKTTSIFGIQRKEMIMSDEEKKQDGYQIIFNFFKNGTIEINTQIGEVETQVLGHQEFDELLQTLENINWNNRDSNKYVF